MVSLFSAVQMEEAQQIEIYEEAYEKIVPKLSRLILINSWLKEVNETKFIYDKVPISFLDKIFEATDQMTEKEVKDFDKYMYYLLTVSPNRAINTEIGTMKSITKMRQKTYKVKHGMNNPKEKSCSKNKKQICKNDNVPETVEDNAFASVFVDENANNGDGDILEDILHDQAIVSNALQNIEQNYDQFSDNSQIQDVGVATFLYDIKSKNFIQSDYPKECVIVHRVLDSFESLRHDLKCELDAIYSKDSWCYLQMKQDLNNLAIDKCYNNLMYTLKAENNVGFLIMQADLLSVVFLKTDLTPKYKRALRRTFSNIIHLHCHITEFSHIILYMLQTGSSYYAVSDLIDVEKYVKKIKQNNDNNIYIDYVNQLHCYCSSSINLFENDDSKTQDTVEYECLPKKSRLSD